jgi:hypothetical protein
MFGCLADRVVVAHPPTADSVGGSAGASLVPGLPRFGKITIALDPCVVQLAIEYIC